MQGSEFPSEVMFHATVRAAGPDGGGYGTVQFMVLLEAAASGSALPLPPEDIAEALKSFVEARGWSIGQFYGRPADQTLDWPEGEV